MRKYTELLGNYKHISGLHLVLHIILNIWEPGRLEGVEIDENTIQNVHSVLPKLFLLGPWTGDQTVSWLVCVLST